MAKSFKLDKYKPVIIALFSLCVFVLIILQYTEFNYDKKEKDVKAKLLEILIRKKSQLEKSLYSRIYYTKGVAAYISLNPGITNEVFDHLADELIRQDTVISTMAISKNCIISAIYPIKGHESALGLNLLEHPFRKKIVDSTIITGNTFVAGPVELVEGGVAFISYTPIFSKLGEEKNKFWGMADIVILKDKLFNEIGLTEIDRNYKYALRGTDGSGMNGACFWGDPNIFEHEPVTVDILLPTGNWSLASVPLKGWESYLNKTEVITIFLYISALIITILIWLLSKAIFKIRSHEKELHAIFASMEDLIIVFDNSGKYLKIAPTNETLLVKTSKELLGKTVHEIFSKQEADFFLTAITECIETKKRVTIDYPLLINAQSYWFRARIAYLTDSSVIFVAHDNTQKKKDEESLIQSEKELKQLNATKDKLFSIIAHDLRSPFQPILSFSEILSSEIETLDQEEIKNFAKDIHNVSQNVFLLIENLLEWAKTQTGNIQFKPADLNLMEIVNDGINYLQENAIQKQIILKNEIASSIIVTADALMLRSVFQNLISNAIKFTHSGGVVTVKAFESVSSIDISVEDSGVGISEERIEQMFQIEHTTSTKGTNHEKGTGLGLILCKEFVEKHGGKIRIESELNKGSKFIISLPINQN